MKVGDLIEAKLAFGRQIKGQIVSMQGDFAEVRLDSGGYGFVSTATLVVIAKGACL